MTVSDSNTSKSLSKPQFNNETRLIIDKIVLNNFKSYFGKECIGPFHPSFSCIVGPNGSGKSNVIDALLFVFGFRANKMRQNKLSGLIHISKAHPDLTECSVEDGFKPIDETRFYIKRTVNKNNSSKYFIDDQTVNYKQIVEFLKDKNIDLEHRRFLILQGEVEFISQMKPKGNNENEEGLLEYLEDIVGTSQYKEKIESYYNELEILTERRTEKLNRLKGYEKEVKKLEERTIEAKEYLNKENELNIQKHLFYTNKIQDLENKIIIEKNKKIKLDEKFHIQESEFSTYRNNDIQLSRTITDISNKISELNSNLKDETTKLDSIVKKDIHIQESRSFFKSKLKKLNKKLEEENRNISALSTNILSLDSNLNQNETELKELKEKIEIDIKILEDISQNLKSKTLDIQLEIDQNMKNLIPWNDKINRVESNMKLIQSQLELIDENECKQNDEITILSNNIDNMNNKKSELSREIGVNRNKINECKKKHIDHKDKLNKFNIEILKEKMQSSKSIYYSMLQNYNSSNSQSKVVKELMVMKSSQKINGIHGRLGSLGRIDPKYNVAVTIACPQLNFIVVDNIKVAQNCIEFLRKNKLGRAVFLCIDQIKDIDNKKLQISIPEKSKRLFSLIVPKNPLYSKLFYHVIKETLVVEDINLANKIAFGPNKWRVVTIDGELIDQSGTMSGGGKKPKYFSMGSDFISDDIVSDKELKLAEEEKCKLEKEYQSTCENQNVLTNTLNDIEKEIEHSENLIKKYEIEIKSIDIQLNNTKLQLNSAKTAPKVETKLKEKLELENRIRIHQCELESYIEERTNIERIINKYKHKILELGGTKFKTQSSKVDLCREKIKLVEENIEKLKLKHTENIKQVNKSQKNINDIQSEISDIEDKLNQLNSTINENTREAKLINKVKLDLESSIDQHEEEKNKLIIELDLLKDKINEFQIIKAEYENSSKNVDIEISKIERIYNSWRSKLNQLHTSFDIKLDNPHTVQYNTLDEKALLSIEEKLEKNKPNLNVIEEYELKKLELEKKQNDFEKISLHKDKVFKEYDDLRNFRLKTFIEAFQTISYKLKEIYQLITGDGLAELEFVDSLDPFSEGVILTVMPPKKSWKIISHLSGALVFALHQFKPTPIYIMDEIDAALDYKNVSIIAKIIETKRIVSCYDTQFIVISLRNNMVELSKRLIGIYKSKDKATNDYSTKSVVLNNE